MPRSRDALVPDPADHEVIELRLSDPAFAERLAAFLRSVGVTAVPAREGVLALEPPVDEDELAIYLRVWGVLNPEGAAELATD